jgi:predicted RNase H-like HicB family nuclease
MDDPVTYDAYLEVGQDGRCLALILDLPGCFAEGSTEQEALAALTAALPPYFGWLRAHDDYTPEVRGPWRVVPRETFHTFIAGDREVHAFFTPDDQSTTDDELDWNLALLDWAHDDLLDLVGSLPPAALDARPAAGGPTIGALVDDVAQGLLWYVSLLDESPVPPAIGRMPGAPAERLRRVHDACVQRLRGASEERHTWVLDRWGERWSMRKVLRRCVWLVRDHTQRIEGSLRP